MLVLGFWSEFTRPGLITGYAVYRAYIARDHTECISTRWDNVSSFLLRPVRVPYCTGVGDEAGDFVELDIIRGRKQLYQDPRCILDASNGPEGVLGM